ncbi:MAG: endonuclease III [Halobacteriaceae archaeon]
MTKNSEPTENISGSGGTDFIADESADTSRSDAEKVVDKLGELYWQKTYGDMDGFTCLIRTILSQNTSDEASQPAFEQLLAEYDEDNLVTSLASASEESIAKAIKSAGLYNQKATVITSIAEAISKEFGDSESFNRFVQEKPYEEVRNKLLSYNGVGPKTADCVLLFAGGKSGVFPVDTHVHRIYRRLGIAPAAADHEEVREILEDQVPPEKCGFGHTASIEFGREYCTAQAPVCLDGIDNCPLAELCDRVGINIEENEVMEPSEIIS